MIGALAHRRRQQLRGGSGMPEAPVIGGSYNPNRPGGLILVKDSPLNDVDAEGWTRTFGGGFTANDPTAPYGPACYEQRFNAGHDNGGAGGQLELVLPVLTTMYCAVNVKFTENYSLHAFEEKFWYPTVGPDGNEHPPYPMNIRRVANDSGPSGQIQQTYRRSPQGDQRTIDDVPFGSGGVPISDQFNYGQTSAAQYVTKGQWALCEMLYEGTGTVGPPITNGGPYPHRLRCWTNNVLVIDDMVAAWWNGTDLGFRLFRLDDTRGGGPDLLNGPLPAQQSRFFSGLSIYGLSAA